MIELLIAIALWCGQPEGSSAFSSNTFRPKVEVQQCRSSILTCLIDGKRGKLEQAAVHACFSAAEFK